MNVIPYHALKCTILDTEWKDLLGQRGLGTRVPRVSEDPILVAPRSLGRGRGGRVFFGNVRSLFGRTHKSLF